MSQNISSNVLFHITSSMKSLKSILKEGFYPHHCPEYLLNKDDRKAAKEGHHPAGAIPMVCFCDLPLSLIHKHLDDYGRYGIGLIKRWGVENRIAPVLYTHGKAQTRHAVSHLTNIETEGKKRASYDWKMLAAHTKPVKGQAWRNHKRPKVVKNVKFYDEREWRYVPAIQQLYLPWEQYKEERKSGELRKIFKKSYSLKVGPDDIQYLILPHERTEDNINDLFDFVIDLYTDPFGKRAAQAAATAILTDDAIKEDS